MNDRKEMAMEENLQMMEMQKKDKKRVSLKTTVIVSLICFMLGASATMGVLVFGTKFVDTNQLSVMQAMTLTQSKFVGPYEWDEVTDNTIRYMVSSLGDRWSYYLNQNEYEQKKHADENAYVGIGISISISEHDAIHVLGVTEDSPAQKAGFLPDEKIIAVDDIVVTEDTWQEAVQAISGEDGTAVRLLVQDEAMQERWVEVTRAMIHTESVVYRTLTEDIGMIRIENFYDETSVKFVEAVNALEEQGVTSIIFDVRNNPGGYVTELIDMLDHIVPAGRLFYSEDINGKETEYYADDQFVDLSYAVLVNANSYSAAEFFAGQMQEMERAIVVGERTVGKGYAQQLFVLPNGGAVGISTAKYFTGGERSLADTGVTPDVVVAFTEQQKKSQLGGRLDDTDDTQLQKAIELLQE